MKRLLVLSALSFVLASAVPVSAQPIEIIVRGGQPAVIPSPLFQGGDDYVYGTPFYDNGNNFDPGAAAINALNVAFPKRSRNFPVNIALAGDLAVHSGSWAEHQEECQANFATYEPATDTILVRGLPERCPL